MTSNVQITKTPGMDTVEITLKFVVNGSDKIKWEIARAHLDRASAFDAAHLLQKKRLKVEDAA